MQLHETSIPELKRISLQLFPDARGFFTERFRLDAWRAAGLPELVQMNHSRSVPGVLRGLHLQHTPAQAKLVGVTRGKIFDVAVDVRPDSPTYLQHVTITLNETEMLWVPEGFLHGFCVLGDEAADVVYYTSANYHAAGEAGVRYDDPSLAINWPLHQPMLSERDTHLPYLADAKNLYKA